MELKFRAWDGKSVRYDVTGFEHGTENEMGGVFLDGVYHEICETHYYKPGQPMAVVMMASPMMDESEKFIYQGDIIKRITKYQGDLFFWVSFDGFRFGCEPIGDVVFYMQPLNHVSDRGLFVVGNIYENPELLKGK